MLWIDGWFVFLHGSQELCRVSTKGSFRGELRSTKELLSFEHSIPLQEITVAYMTREQANKQQYEKAIKMAI